MIDILVRPVLQVHFSPRDLERWAYLSIMNAVLIFVDDFDQKKCLLYAIISLLLGVTDPNVVVSTLYSGDL
jgi:hypothetical protein